MTEENSFASFIGRIRAGDPQAAEEFVRRYESVIRRQARFTMTDPRLGRLFDSMDLSQTVLRSFFFRAALGQYDLDNPERLLNLLITMTRRKVALKARQQRSRPVDQRQGDGSGLEELAITQGPSPSEQVALRDLTSQVCQRLSAEELQVYHLRLNEGCAWPDIATRLGGTPAARRKQWERALDRVAHELGIDDDRET